MADLVIYGTPVSPFVHKAEAVLKTQAVDYDFEDGSAVFVGETLSLCQKMLSKLVPEKVDLS